MSYVRLHGSLKSVEIYDFRLTAFRQENIHSFIPDFFLMGGNQVSRVVYFYCLSCFKEDK